MNTYSLAKYEGIDGGMSVIWEVGHVSIAHFIKEMRLEPVPRNRLPMREEVAKLAQSFPGGWRLAHLHFDGDIYLLNQEQWTQFAKARVEEFSRQLENTSTISFQNFMEVGEALAAASPTLPLPPPKGA